MLVAPSNVASGLRVSTMLSLSGRGRNFSGMDSHVLRPITTCEAGLLTVVFIGGPGGGHTVFSTF